MTTIVLSRLPLALRRPQVVRQLFDVQQVHRALLQAFPGQSRADAQLLYRLESDGILWTQSHVVPDWTLLPDRWLRAPVKGQVIEIPILSAGMPVRFRLFGNPTKDVYHNPALRIRQRVPLIAPDEQRTWLERHLERGGLAVRSVRMSDAASMHGWRGDNRMAFGLVRYDGVGIVQDGARLAQTIISGIGHGKAYGAGMLSLMPVREGAAMGL